MNEQINEQRSIARHIIDGSITINSVSEFEKMIKIFPSDPALYNAFADLLFKKKSYEAAAKSYEKATGLFIDSGRMFPAIFFKILQWRITRPTLHEIRPFYSVLRRTSFKPNPLQVFFKSLSFPEMVAVTNRLERVRFSRGKIVKKIGDVEDNLYFIASGTLKDTTYKPLNREEKVHRKSVVYLYECDILGDIFPFEEEKISQSYTEAVTYAELGKISKLGMIRVCKSYPNVARAIIKLFEDCAASAKEGSSRPYRKTGRQSLPIKMKVKVQPKEADYPPFIIDGYSRDISIGGICLVLDAKNTNIDSIDNTIKNAGIEISIPGEAFSLNVAGNVSWSKEVLSDGKKTLALGIKFKKMTPKMSGMLIVFADMLYND